MTTPSTVPQRSERFLVYAAGEGLEQEPRVKIIPEAEARRRFAETGGQPVAGEIYGSRWDHIHVERVVGTFTAVEDALRAALDAAVAFQAEMEALLAQELLEAEDDEDRRQVQEYYEGHREVFVAFDPGGGTSPTPVEESVVALVDSKRCFQEFVRRARRTSQGR